MSLSIIAISLCLVFFVWKGFVLRQQYRLSIVEVEERLAAKSQLVEIPLGKVEYLLKGESGPVVLISHGGAGGFDQGLLTAQSHLKGSFRVISVSRFGHLRSPIIKGANAKLQADVYASLLDYLRIDKVSIIGSSGGGPSAIQFAQQYSNRCNSLILSGAVSKYLAPRSKLVYKSDFVYWFVITKLKRIALRKIGVSKEMESKLLENEKAFLSELFKTMNPISLRRAGLFSDIDEWADLGAWSKRYCLEEINLPVLIIHAKNDSVVPYNHALHVKRLIRGSELMTLPDGGHLKFGYLGEVQNRVSEFVNKNYSG